MTATWPVRAVERLAPQHFPPGRLTVAVFGPGEGEAIVVALPDGRFGVLDGCAENADPVAALIKQLDRERGDDWRFAFMGLTHPHEDHYAGLGRLLETYCDRIDQWWECPLGERQAHDLHALWVARKKGRKEYERNTDVDSLPRVLRAMEQAASKSGKDYRTPVKDLTLVEDRLADGSRVSAMAVGPAQADIRRSTLGLAQGAYAMGTGTPRSSYTIDPNYTSAAILIRWERAGVLLGGDLLGDEEGHLGWAAARQSRAFDDRPVQVVKCAHHASVGAHDMELWERLRPRLALVTPFKRAMTTKRGSENPPRPEQIDHLVRGGCAVVITSRPQWPAAPGHPRPQGVGRSSPLPAVSDDSGAKNDAVALTPRAGRTALDNAVAVTLDASGEIAQVVLAGEADFYAA